MPIRKPDFEFLLSKPLLQIALPSSFNLEEESAHLNILWDTIPALRQYNFKNFVHAGGSGMVFKVCRPPTNISLAMKIARKKLLSREGLPKDAAHSLSPVPEPEMRALEKLSHPNLVRLIDTVSNEKGVIAIVTTYVENPQPLDEYLKKTLTRSPRNVLQAFSHTRLDHACTFVLEKVLEIAEALSHMHKEGIFHFDIKPTNILISSKRDAILTDLGACIHTLDIQKEKEIRVHFTWTYAHPDLTTMIHQPASISSGGLKASAALVIRESVQKYDLFAFGRTLQEILAILESEFGERSHASYGFRYLHLISCMLLDGHNAPLAERIRIRHHDGRRFVSDTALNYPVDLFTKHKITTASELVDRLRRYSREYSWHARIPELNLWQPMLINTGLPEPAPFTERVSKILSHPALRRLKSEAQLGFMREVYPSATHNRWSHTIGVFAALVRYYNALLSDPEVPTLRIFMDTDDLCHAMLAALLHDIGQVSFGHDLEESCPLLFNHNKIIERLLTEKAWSEYSLTDVIKAEWNNVDVQRVLNILTKNKMKKPIDGVAEDIIDGPIDADKLDYLRRDSISCGVVYGHGIDVIRFLPALSIDAKINLDGCRLALAYKAKGSSAIESVLLARYQMFGAVYWHHSFRCIQAMFSHAVALTFGSADEKGKKFRGIYVDFSLINDLLYHWVICGRTINEIKKKYHPNIPAAFLDDPPSHITGERVLEFVWKFANDEIRQLLERLGKRDLYKRVMEVKISDLGDRGDYSALCVELEPKKRPELAEKIETGFIDSINKKMAERGPRRTTTTESAVRKRLQDITQHPMPRIIIDFPTRGLPEEINFPNELSDPARKYTGVRATPFPSGKVFYIVRDLLAKKATLRIFAAPELHELIIRYLDPEDVESCVATIITRIRIIR